MAAKGDLCSEGEAGWAPALLTPVLPEDPRYLRVEHENDRALEFWRRGLASRAPYPVIVNGDFSSRNGTGVPYGWTTTGSPTTVAVTGPGLGSGLEISGGSGRGITYDFNVKPCTHYTVVFDFYGDGEVEVGRTGQAFSVIHETSWSGLGTGRWYRCPSPQARIFHFKSSSTDTSLRIRLLTTSANTMGIAQVQIWEGRFPRPFQDIGQAMSSLFGQLKFTQGSVPFANSSGALTEDNSGLFWDGTNGRLGIQTASPNSSLHSNGSLSLKHTETDVDMTTSGNTIVSVTNTAAARTITLATADTVAGRIVIVKDTSGGAGTNNITVATEGSETIDGAATIAITANYGVARLYSDGSNWFTL